MEHRMDELAREMAGGLSRREALRRLGGGMAAACLAGLGLGKAWGQSGGVACGNWCQGAVGFDPRNAASRARFTACVPSCDHCQEDGGKICGTTTAGSVICCEQTDTCCGTGCCPAGQVCCGGSCCGPGQVCDGLTCADPPPSCCPGDGLFLESAPSLVCLDFYGHPGHCQICDQNCPDGSSTLYIPGSRTGAQCDPQCADTGV